MRNNRRTQIALDSSCNPSEGTVHINLEEDQMNTKNATALNVKRATDIHWHDLGREVVVLVPCDEPGCYSFGTPHVLTWGDMLMHRASEVTAPDTHVEVVKFAASEEVPEAESYWYVAGWLDDSDTRLTPERVAFFTAHYNSAVALAAELNGEVPC